MYQIIRDKSFDKEFEKILGSHDRLLEIESAIDWMLARDPERFENIGDGYYLWRTEELTTFPAILLVYHVDSIYCKVTLCAASHPD